MKRFLSILLTLALLGSLVAVALADDASDVITLTVFRGDPGDQPTEDNKIYKLIEEKFGIKFNFTYLTGDLDQTLSTRLASGSYPDLFDG
ncbi:MAG: hypothetical protein IKI84_09260, partial [Clostridia bacterium]|nr:hypothetical protein [Clostridia bacterium]